MAKIILTFDVLVNIEYGDPADLGNVLAAFLQECFFNGEDVFEVSFTGYKKED